MTRQTQHITARLCWLLLWALLGSACSGGDSASPELCGDAPCERGVCDVSAGQCVNAQACSREREQQDCVADHVCVDQRCISEEALCAQLACTRGVCSADARACVSDARCEGDDARCVAGEVCAPDGTCQPRSCEVVDCARGVCDAGLCVNPAACSSGAACLEAHLCQAGRCVSHEVACERAACGAGERCVIDAQAEAARCEMLPAPTCENALGCAQDMICAHGQCVSAPACEMTPASSPIPFANVAPQGALTATLCQGGESSYSLNTRRNTPQLGKLVATLSVAPRDIGAGEPTLELRGIRGELLVSVRATQGVARVETEVTLVTQGVYQIVVRDSGDTRSPGLRYKLVAGLFEPALVSACDAPRELRDDALVRGSTVSGASQGMSLPCGEARANAPQELWRVSLSEPALARLTLTPDPGSAPLTLGLRGACLADETDRCVNATSSAVTLTRALTAGEHWVVVQGVEGAGGSYRLGLTLEPTQCSDADTRCQDEDTSLSCDSRGAGLTPVACDGGCDVRTGMCARRLGDQCEAPLLMRDDTLRLDIDWLALSPTLDPGVQGCVAGANLVERTTGPDQAIAITLEPGHVLQATLSASTEPNALYLLDACDAQGEGCLKGGLPSGAGIALTWYNDSAMPRTVTLVADIARVTPAMLPSVLNITRGPAACTPRQYGCDISPEGQPISRRCDADGLRVDSSAACAYGCDVTGQCAGLPNGRCDDAIALTSGVPVTGTLEQADHAHQLPDPVHGCIPVWPSVNVAYYKISANAGDVIEATLSASSNATRPIELWIAQSCDAGLAQGCVSEQPLWLNETTSTNQYIAPISGDYLIAARAWGGAGPQDWLFTLEASVSTPSCDASVEGPSCAADDLVYCDSDGLWASLSCDGGCTSGACGAPRGDACHDAIALVGASGSVTGDLSDYTARQQVRADAQLASCQLNEPLVTRGPDAFYRVDLSAGDLLRLTSATTNLLHIMVMTRCDVTASCLEAAQGYFLNRSWSYHAQQAQTLYIAVDTYLTPPLPGQATYTLSWDIISGLSCDPNTPRCADPTTVARCDASGQVETLQSCTGACERGGCTIDHAARDACATVQASAEDVGAGVTLYVDTAQLTNNLSLLTPNSCAGTQNTLGPDSFYRVTLQPDEVLHAQAQLLSDTPGRPVLYVVEGCTNPALECVAMSDYDGRLRRATLTYRNRTEVSQTLLVAIDGSNNLTGSIVAQLEVTATQCQEGASRCAPLGDAMEVCTAQGRFVRAPCDGACVAGACVNPAGDFCQDAIALQGPTGTLSDNFINSTDTFALPLGIAGACHTSQASARRDRFYQVSLNAGDLLEVSASHPAQARSMRLMLLEGCGPSDLCAQQSPERGVATLRYVAPTSAQVIVVVEPHPQDPSGDYALTWSITPAQGCVPSRSRCVDSEVVAMCDSAGQLEALASCPLGCAVSGCVADPLAHDACADVISSAQDAPARFSWLLDLSQHTSAIGLTSTCTGAQSGSNPDAFYRVSVAPGATLEVSATALNNAALMLYLVTDCDDYTTTCLAGAVAPSDDATATLSYTNTTGVPLTLVVGVSMVSGAPGLVQLHSQVRTP